MLISCIHGPPTFSSLYEFQSDYLQTFLMDYLKLSETERFMIGHQLRDLVKIFSFEKEAKKNSTSIRSFSLQSTYGSGLARSNILYQLTCRQTHPKSLIFTHHHPHAIVDTYPPSPTCDLWYFDLISTTTHMWSEILWFNTHHHSDHWLHVPRSRLLDHNRLWRRGQFHHGLRSIFSKMFSALILIDQRQSGVRFTETASTFSPPMSLLANPHWLEPAMDSVLSYR